MIICALVPFDSTHSDQVLTEVSMLAARRKPNADDGCNPDVGVDASTDCAESVNNVGASADDAAGVKGDSDAGERLVTNLAAICLRAGVLIGLHPDEATDHIVDVAMALGKPWVIVCVAFPFVFVFAFVRTCTCMAFNINPLPFC